MEDFNYLFMLDCLKLYLINEHYGPSKHRIQQYFFFFEKNIYLDNAIYFVGQNEIYTCEQNIALLLSEKGKQF